MKYIFTWNPPISKTRSKTYNRLSHARSIVIVSNQIHKTSKTRQTTNRLSKLMYPYSVLFFHSPSLFSHSGNIPVRRESSTESGVHRCQAKVFTAVTAASIFLFSIALTYSLINENRASVSSGDQFCVVSRLFKHTVVEFEHIFVWFWLYNWRRSF